MAPNKKTVTASIWEIISSISKSLGLEDVKTLSDFIFFPLDEDEADPDSLPSYYIVASPQQEKIFRKADNGMKNLKLADLQELLEQLKAADYRRRAPPKTASNPVAITSEKENRTPASPLHNPSPPPSTSNFTVEIDNALKNPIARNKRAMTEEHRVGGGIPLLKKARSHSTAPSKPESAPRSSPIDPLSPFEQAMEEQQQQKPGEDEHNEEQQLSFVDEVGEEQLQQHQQHQQPQPQPQHQQQPEQQHKQQPEEEQEEEVEEPVQIPGQHSATHGPQPRLHIQPASFTLNRDNNVASVATTTPEYYSDDESNGYELVSEELGSFISNIKATQKKVKVQKRQLEKMNGELATERTRGYTLRLALRKEGEEKLELAKKVAIEEEKNASYEERFADMEAQLTEERTNNSKNQEMIAELSSDLEKQKGMVEEKNKENDRLRKALAEATERMRSFRTSAEEFLRGRE